MSGLLLPGDSVSTRLRSDLIGPTLCPSTSMGGHRVNGPAPAPGGQVLMQVQTNEAPRTPKRIKIDRGLYQRTKDGRYEAGFVGADGKWHLKTLAATKLKDARKEKKLLDVRADQGQQVAPSRTTFAQVAEEFLASCEARVASGALAPRTYDHYKGDLERHVLPKLGTHEIQRITPDILAAFFAEKRKKLSAWSCRGLLTPTSRIFALAVRRGYLNDNPLRKLDSSELPQGRNASEARVLTREELTKLLSNTPDTYRAVIATLAFTGMRLQEALGLVWEEVDFEAGIIRVTAQLTRATKTQPARRAPLKAKGSRREIRLEPDLAALLKKHREAAFAVGRARPEDYVFLTSKGTPLYYRNVAERGLSKAADSAGLNRPGIPALSCHDLRHTFGSHLVRSGLDIVRVSRQLGHARPSITLDVYAHEVEAAQHADDLQAKLTASFGGIL
jgi:integrase